MSERSQKVVPYLVVTDAQAQIAFLRDVLGATEVFKTEQDGAIQHAEFEILGSSLMLGQSDDGFPGMLYLQVDDVDVFHQRALDAGAKSVRDPEDQPHGERMSGVEDPQGNQWWFAGPLAG